MCIWRYTRWSGHDWCRRLLNSSGVQILLSWATLTVGPCRCRSTHTTSLQPCWRQLVRCRLTSGAFDAVERLSHSWSAQALQVLDHVDPTRHSGALGQARLATLKASFDSTCGVTTPDPDPGPCAIIMLVSTACNREHRRTFMLPTLTSMGERRRQILDRRWTGNRRCNCKTYPSWHQAFLVQVILGLRASYPRRACVAHKRGRLQCWERTLRQYGYL